jgi:hypothetical protein
VFLMGGTRFTPLACMKSGLVVWEAGLRVKPSLLISPQIPLKAHLHQIGP